MYIYMYFVYIYIYIYVCVYIYIYILVVLLPVLVFSIVISDTIRPAVDDFCRVCSSSEYTYVYAQAVASTTSIHINNIITNISL